MPFCLKILTLLIKALRGFVNKNYNHTNGWTYFWFYDNELHYNVLYRLTIATVEYTSNFDLTEDAPYLAIKDRLWIGI